MTEAWGETNDRQRAAVGVIGANYHDRWLAADRGYSVLPLRTLLGKNRWAARRSPRLPAPTIRHEHYCVSNIRVIQGKQC